MGEVIQFVSKSERERLGLIREARARYDSVFPPTGPLRKESSEDRATHAAGSANARGDGGLA